MGVAVYISLTASALLVVRMGTVQAFGFLKAGELTTKGKGGKVRTIHLSSEAQVVLVDARIDGFARRHRDKVMAHDRETPITYHGLRYRYA